MVLLLHLVVTCLVAFQKLLWSTHFHNSKGGIEFRTDDKLDHNALPLLDHFILQDMIGTNITIAGSFAGLQKSPFTDAQTGFRS